MDSDIALICRDEDWFNLIKRFITTIVDMLITLYNIKNNTHKVLEFTEDSTTQFKLNTDDKAITFFILVWISLWARDVKTANINNLEKAWAGNDKLINSKGITFCGIAIHRNTGHSTFDIIDTNHIWKGAIPSLAATTIRSKFSNKLWLKSFSTKQNNNNTEILTWKEKYFTPTDLEYLAE